MRSFVPALIKLIIFLIITSLLTYVLAVTITNEAFGATNAYSANFSDVTGLENGDDVRIAGVRVGSVTDIKIIKRDGHDSMAQVGFTVQRSRSLPTSATATMRYRNLIGQRYIDVQQGAGAAGSTMKPGDTIPLSQTSPAVDLTVLFAGFQPLVQGLDPGEINTLSLEIIKTLQGEGGSLELLFGNLADLTNSLADKDKVIGDVIDNLTSVLTAIGNRDAELKSLIIQLTNFVSSLANDRKTIGNAIVGVNNLATSTAGLLTKIRPPLKQDVTDLTGLLTNLNREKPTIRFVVNQLAPTLAGLVRTAEYGSWFNFYLCTVSGTLTLPGNKVLDLNLSPKSPQPRCN